MDETKCAKCGTPALPDARFCESCGAPLVTGGVQPTQEPPAQPVVPATQPQAQQPQPPMQSYQQPQAQQPQQQMQGYLQVGRKKPWLAALLGILIVGVGHMYLGMWAKGIGILVIGIIVSVATGAILAPVVWIISCVWAYYDAKAYNRKAGYPE
jgi:predicted lipid-binding transport protein (Tim44 family)